MGISCSLRGHDWGEPYVESDSRSREDGSVKVKREVKDCTRCDETKVIKEQKTALGTDGQSSEPTDTAEQVEELHSQTSTSTPTTTTPSTNTQSTTMTDEKHNSSEQYSADGGIEPDAGDEGVIIMGDDDEDETEEVQSHETETADETEEELDAGAFDAKRDVNDIGPQGQEKDEANRAADTREYSEDLVPDSEKHDVEIMGSGSSDSSSNETSTEQTNTTTSQSTTEEEQPSSTASRQEERTESWNERTPEPTESEDAVVCPNCSFSAPTEEVHVFAGDACPECRKGYLQER